MFFAEKKNAQGSENTIEEFSVNHKIDVSYQQPENHHKSNRKEVKGAPENIDYALARHYSFLAQPQAFQQYPS